METDVTEMKMLVSGVIEQDGEKKACVYFEDGARYAEGYIPDCKIVKSKDFSDEEIRELEEYLRENLLELEKTAAGINPISALMKE